MKIKPPCLTCGHANHSKFACYALVLYDPIERTFVSCPCRRYRRAGSKESKMLNKDWSDRFHALGVKHGEEVAALSLLIAEKDEVLRFTARFATCSKAGMCGCDICNIRKAAETALSKSHPSVKDAKKVLAVVEAAKKPCGCSRNAIGNPRKHDRFCPLGEALKRVPRAK